MKMMTIRLGFFASLLMPALCSAQSGNLPVGGLLPAGNEPAQKPEQAQEEDIADWLIEVSNLPPESRAMYAAAFQEAKKCYAQGRLIECESHLNTCETFTRSNPNVWNLRASAMISQKRFAEAEPLLKQARLKNPQDAVARLSLSLLYLGTQEFEKCIAETDELIDEIRYRDMMQLTRSLTFRKFLCLIMLERMDEAKALVADIGPMDDSPLYYYSQAVFAYLKGDRQGALRELNTADSIYRGIGYISGYKQALEYSGVIEKFAPGSAR